MCHYLPIEIGWWTSRFDGARLQALGVASICTTLDRSENGQNPRSLAWWPWARALHINWSSFQVWARSQQRQVVQHPLPSDAAQRLDSTANVSKFEPLQSATCFAASLTYDRYSRHLLTKMTTL
jgi:hypothetical protein